MFQLVKSTVCFSEFKCYQVLQLVLKFNYLPKSAAQPPCVYCLLFLQNHCTECQISQTVSCILQQQHHNKPAVQSWHNWLPAVFQFRVHLCQYTTTFCDNQVIVETDVQHLLLMLCTDVQYVVLLGHSFVYSLLLLKCCQTIL